MKLLKGTVIAMAAAILFAPLLESCKKGSEDPFISFRSRDGRLIGVWILTSKSDTSIDKSEYTNSGNTSTQTTTTTTEFDGKKETTESEYVSSGGGSTYSSTTTWESNLEVTLRIKEDGSYHMKSVEKLQKYSYTNSTGTSNTQIYSDTTNTDTENGEWYWGDDKKNKVNLILESGFFPVKYRLKELSNKQMRWTKTVTDSSINDGTNVVDKDYDFDANHWTWEKQE